MFSPNGDINIVYDVEAPGDLFYLELSGFGGHDHSIELFTFHRKNKYKY